jgi:hypothetical protein
MTTTTQGCNLNDILDQCSIQFTRLRGSSSFNPYNIVFRIEVGNMLKEITRRFNQISESKNKFLLREGGIVRERLVKVADEASIYRWMP